MRNILAALKLCSDVEKRYPHQWFNLFIFPFLMLAPMIFLMKYVGMGMTEMSFIITGMIMWRFVYLLQLGISFGYLIPIWERTIREYHSSPIKNWEYLMGFWIYWMALAAVAVVYMSLLAWLLVGFNFFAGGLMILPVIAMFAIFAIPMSLVTISVIYTFGTKADLIAWSMTDLIIFLSGAFYPVTVFPDWLRSVSYMLPSTWGIIAIRSAFSGSLDYLAFGIFAASTAAFLVIMCFVYMKLKKRALKTGFMQKYA